MLSRLSADAAVSQESFRGILEYMLGFIEKDKQTEGLIEKLCNRFPQTTGACKLRRIKELFQVRTNSGYSKSLSCLLGIGSGADVGRGIRRGAMDPLARKGDSGVLGFRGRWYSGSLTRATLFQKADIPTSKYLLRLIVERPHSQILEVRLIETTSQVFNQNRRV
jgi:hypothetical protein